MYVSPEDGAPALFELPHGEDGKWAKVHSVLSARQARLLQSALDFHALDNPGADLVFFVYIAKAGDYTHLTDFSTRGGEHGTKAQLIGSFSVTSTARGALHSHYSPVQGKWVPETETGERHIVLDRDPETITANASLSRLSPYWRLRAEVERRYPAEYDRLRQALLNRRERELDRHRIPRIPSETIPRTDVGAGGPDAILIGLHWLDLGGAERWAIETIRMARDAGFVPIVITDVPSSHTWITRPELEGAVVIALTHPVGQPEHSEPLLEALMQNFTLRGVFVHHCLWLYNRLPWLKTQMPEIPVADTLHILEYNGGGYPYHSARYDDFIDVHHVISPQLQDWFQRVQGVQSSKIALAPLIGVTTDDASAAREMRPRTSDTSFTVAFVGRLAHQKRPYLFVKLARKLVDEGLPVTFIIHGSGELSDFVRNQVTKYDLNSVVELVAEKTPVSETLQKADLLVVSSQNEGVTLTTIEAIDAGVPVLSADVGSQRTLVAESALVPRPPHSFVERATRIIAGLVESEDAREEVWRQERQLADEFSGHQSAPEWTKELYTRWHQ